MPTWDPDTQYMQAGIDNRRFVSAKYTFLASGPPRLGQLGGGAALAATLEPDNGSAAVGNIVHPMGFIQNLSLGQNKQIARIFEIGSDRSYFIPGRAVGQLSLGRIYMHGPTLLRLFYAAYQDKIGPTQVDAMITSSAVASNANPHDIIVPPGFENVFLNLQSDLFDQHFGLAMYIKDNNKDTMGAMYFESVNIPQHGLQTDANGVVFSENAGLQYDRMVPIRMGAPVPLISARTPDNRPGYEDGYPGLGVLDGGHQPLLPPGSLPGDRADPRGSPRQGPPVRPFAGGYLHRTPGRAPLPGGICHHHVHTSEPARRWRQARCGVLRVGHVRHHGQRHRAGGGRTLPGVQPQPLRGSRLHCDRPYRGCHSSDKGTWMSLPDTAALAVHFGTEHALREKQAGVLDIAGRLAAAAVLIQLIDSQRRPPNEVRHAERALGPTLRMIEQEAGQRATGIGPGDFQTRPRMFIPANRLDPEAERDFYQMGFLPNVPIGMDHGMVRLASAEKAAAPLPLPKVPLLQRARNWIRPPAPTPGAAPVPQAPLLQRAKDWIQPRVKTVRVGENYKPQPRPAAPSAPPTYATPSNEWGWVGPTAAVAAGIGVAAGLPKAIAPVLDYGEQETRTPWNMQPYGAPRLNTTVNAYGQPMP